MVEYLKEYLKINDVEYKEKQKLEKYSPIKIGGEAEIIAFPNTENKFIDLISFCLGIGAKFKIVGNMSNILPSDEGYKGIIIKTDRLNKFNIYSNVASAACGVKLPSFALTLAKAELSGFEGLSGIPGQIGGSVRGNAGAFGREIGDIIVSCSVYSMSDKKVYDLSNKEIGFSYRKSLFSDYGLVLLSATFEFAKAYRDLILSEMTRCKEIRKATQPTDKPSLGSFFRRTEYGISAAKLIDDCGLKGMRIGGAGISEKHAGFIINVSDATSSDVLTLASIVEEQVFNRFSTTLLKEVEILD